MREPNDPETPVAGPPVAGPPDAGLAVRLARLLARTQAEGPGLRTAIWVQGCSIRCPGCCNPQLFGSRGGTDVPVDALVGLVLAADTSGVTLLGGEPFDQATALAGVAAGVRAAGRSVMTFTGYTVAEVRAGAAAGRAGFADLLAGTDLLVAGPYLRDQLDTVRPWVGSTNQEFLLLGDRFPHLLDQVATTPDRIEIRVDPSGAVAVNGWAAPEALDQLLRDLPGR